MITHVSHSKPMHAPQSASLLLPYLSLSLPSTFFVKRSVQPHRPGRDRRRTASSDYGLGAPLCPCCVETRTTKAAVSRPPYRSETWNDLLPSQHPTSRNTYNPYEEIKHIIRLIHAQKRLHNAKIGTTM